MPYKITPYCIKCGGCSSMCPAEAISEGENTYYIDQGKCTGCGVCLEQNHCPAQAIIKE